MLEARGLTKYYSAIPAAQDVSFTIARGEVLGLLGPNGSGKSTTVSMVTALLEPSGGHVLLDSRDIRDDAIAYKARLGYVPEDAHLYTYLTGPEYLLLVGELRGLPRSRVQQKIDGLLDIFGLTDDRYAPISAYSKGMRQKILISAALLHDPDVVVMDEPCSGLDVTSTLVLRSLVQALAAEGKMIIYSSHILEMVERVATNVLILHESRVVAYESVSRLRELVERALSSPERAGERSGAGEGPRGTERAWRGAGAPAIQAMMLPSLEQVFREVVHAGDVEAQANRVVEVMKL